MNTKLLLSLVVQVIFFTQTTNAQIPNQGFENWTPAGTYDEPDGWATFNFATAFGAPVSAFKSTSASSGSYAIKLVTDSSMNPMSGTKVLMPGTAYPGTTFMNGNKVGFAYTSRPSELTAMYKFNPGLGDSCSIIVRLSKWDTVLHKRDTIGLALFTTGNSVVTYAKATLSIKYNSTATPDTAVITLSSSYSLDSSLTWHSELFVDDLNFILSNGINILSKKGSEFLAFPIPADNIVNVMAEGKLIEIKNYLGQTIKYFSVKGNHHVLDVSDLLNGNYIINVDNISNRKLTVVHN